MIKTSQFLFPPNFGDIWLVGGAWEMFRKKPHGNGGGGWVIISLKCSLKSKIQWSKNLPSSINWILLVDPPLACFVASFWGNPQSPKKNVTKMQLFLGPQVGSTTAWNSRISIPHLPVPYIFGSPWVESIVTWYIDLPGSNRFQRYRFHWKMRECLIIGSWTMKRQMKHLYLSLPVLISASYFWW